MMMGELDGAPRVSEICDPVAGGDAFNRVAGSPGRAWPSLAHPSRRAFLCQITGHACGLLEARRVADDYEILDVLTHSDYRRRGVARALMDALHSHAAAEPETIARIVLEVREDNAGARALYDACGYLPIARRSEYYPARNENGRRVDALLLERRLRGASSAQVVGAQFADRTGQLGKL